MTSVLSDLQADYERRAQQAAQAPVSPAAVEPARIHTKVYTGAALSRRQEWGRFWGGILQAAAHDLRESTDDAQER